MHNVLEYLIKPLYFAALIFKLHDFFLNREIGIEIKGEATEDRSRMNNNSKKRSQINTTS